MEINSFIVSHLQAHYKKLLLLCTATASVYLIKRYLDKKRESNANKSKKKLKEFPTVEEIQKFIEDLPFDAVASGKTVTLKDLLGELSEFSEDEEWKELIASVHNMYEDNRENIEETGSVVSIYEDPNVLTFSSPREEQTTVGKEDTETTDDKATGDYEKEPFDKITEQVQSQGMDTSLGNGDDLSDFINNVT